MDRSEFKAAIEDGRLQIPEKRNNFFMVFVADDAFPMKRYLLKPYRARDLSKEQLIFNYRLSRARRVVENAFGILAMRFRVLLNSMMLEPVNVKKVVMACCILHNILRRNASTARSYILTDVDSENVNTGELIEGNWRSRPNQMTELEESRINNRSTNEAINIRTNLTNFFNNEGAVPFQYNIFD